MTVSFPGTRYDVRLAQGPTDRVACESLRHQCFFGGPGRDHDPFDAQCYHLMVSDMQGLVATCRILPLRSGREIGQSYAAARYDLSRLAGYPHPMMELGRFCVSPRAKDGDVMRMVWGALAQIVDQNHIGMLFGCLSFAGVDPVPYAAGFALLAERYLAAPALRPEMNAPEVVPLARGSTVGGVGQLPPLLRTYLSMGGWVSDHAVIDRELATLHVFTGVEIANIPPRRAAALRAVAQAAGGTIDVPMQGLAPVAGPA